MDVIDVKVAQELTEVLSRTPAVSPDVVTVAKQEEVKIIDTLVENISKPEFQVVISAQASTSAQGTFTALAAETLNPVPQTLEELVDLKNEVPEPTAPIPEAPKVGL